MLYPDKMFVFGKVFITAKTTGLYVFQYTVNVIRQMTSVTECHTMGLQVLISMCENTTVCEKHHCTSSYRNRHWHS